MDLDGADGSFAMAAAGFEDFPGDEGVADLRSGEVGSALKAVAGVGVDLVAAGGGADGGGVKPGGFHEDVFRFSGDHGVVSAHDAGERESFGVVCDDEVLRR